MLTSRSLWCGVVVVVGAGCSDAPRYPSSTRGEPVVSRAGSPVNPNAGRAIQLPAGGEDETNCDPYAVRPLGSHWSPFTDDGCATDNATSIVVTSWQGTEPRWCETRWTAHVPAEAGSFAGIESEVMTDLTKVKSIKFQVRGEGRSVRGQLAAREQIHEGGMGDDDCHSEWYDFFGEVFRCGDGTEAWKDVELKLDELKQRGWGRVIEKKLEDLVRFQVVTEERPVEAFQCELRQFELVLKAE